MRYQSQEFFYAFAVFEQHKAILDSLGSGNRKGFLNSNFRVFIWTSHSDWLTACLDVRGVMSHM